jgi:hypothetical protein
MSDLIIKLAKGEKISDEDIASGLYEICDNVHSSCDNSCPVYELNGGKALDTAKNFKVNRGCDCFKNGTAMLKFIRKKLK